MSSRSADAPASARAVVEHPRPLPAHPSLEFERKRAKKLLREMKKTDTTAKLADAQFAVAREYGFTSWPRLVEYFEVSARHELSAFPSAWYKEDTFDEFAQQILGRHRRKQPPVAMLIGEFVPRFFGRSIDEILAATLTIDDARLVVARQNRMPSWEALLAFARSQENEGPTWETFDPQLTNAYAALRRSDLATIAPIVDARPELLRSPARLDPARTGFVVDALFIEWNTQTAEARAVTDWLAARGADLQFALQWRLLNFGPFGYPIARDTTGVAFVQFLLDRGADPNWTPPNGISVLEHLILRARRHQVVDLVASKVKPRRAFWIAAGLGDVKGLSRYFDANGKLTEAAKRDRPDFLAVGGHGGIPRLPDDDDRNIMWEAFYIAANNSRANVMDALLERGLPIDYAPLGYTMMGIAVGSQMVWVVEYLVRRGARADIAGTTPGKMDEWLYQRYKSYQKTAHAERADALRIYELCGGTNADEVMRRVEVDAPEAAKPTPVLARVLGFAKVDAARLGQADVRPENLLVGLLHNESHPPLRYLHAAGTDLVALHQAIDSRLAPNAPGATIPNLPLSTSANAVLETAGTLAGQTNGGYVMQFHLLSSLLADPVGPVAAMLTGAGCDLAKLRAEIERVR